MRYKVINKKTLVFVTFYFFYILILHKASSEEEVTSRRSRSCTTILKTPGACVSLRKCEPIVKLLQKNPQAANRVIVESACSQSASNLKVCCPLPEHKDQNNKEHDATKSPQSKPLSPPQCGYSNSPHDRVVGGNPSSLGAWPWIALIGYGISSRVSFRCGGTLVSSRHVVTAAHCVHGLTDLRLVRLGEHELSNSNDGAHPIDVLVEKATIHPKFNPNNMENDIAILKLKKDVTFTDAIHPICLPLADDIKNRDFTRHYPFIAGWGATSYKGHSSKILREAQVPVVNNAQCKVAYQRVRNTVIDNRVLCAGYPQGGKDSCQGDSGGSLMYPQRNTYYLIGVVSGGYGCGEPGYPGIYTRVTQFLNFILSNMN